MLKERWRAIPGFDKYEVSNLGRVRRDGRILKSRPNKRKNSTGTVGYPQVDLTNNKGKRKTRRVHQLVAFAFLGKVPRNHVVNHIDGVKDNPLVWNLEITTLAGNTQHAWATGLCQRKAA